MSRPAVLADFCDLVSQHVDPTTLDTQCLYLGMEHLAPGRMRPIAFGCAGDVQSHKFSFRKGDVLYGKLRPYLDKAVMVSSDGVCTTELLVFRPKPSVDPRYLACLVHAPDFVEHAMSGVTGAQHPRTSWSHVSQFPVPGLDEQEQRSIADLLWRVHDLMIACQSSEQTAQALKRTAMRELFMRGLRGEPQQETRIGLVPESWKIVPLESLGKIGNGSTPKRSVPAYWNGGTYPWLTSAKVYDREIEAADQFVTDTALDECHLPRVKPDAVLMAITGQGKTLGHCAVLKIEATISQHVAYLQTDTEKAEPSFIRGYLESQYEYLRQVAAGGGSTKGALTCAFLKSLPVPLPSKDEQREVAAILDTLDRRIDLHRKKRSVLEELFKSLLHKLITGEISVSDLDLSVLLSASTQREEIAA
ncbi:restriction endonuclease subunit S [Burkholderia pseudomallei]|uniref:restriction endonuclease subunit S n=1 Tax=Burkholderia pseudomallei TaxID=28450 RepID=UPI000F08AA16|nr:restriction endonuclease subunit S [Burkholderia pseudomallei]VBI73259.1 restriction endonuclease S subunits-like protein [Burkholderia pseudomallei]